MPIIADLLDDGMARFDFWREEGITPIEISLDGATRERCRDFAKRMRDLGVDSKWDMLHGSIRGLRRSRAVKKVIIYAQWLPTYNISGASWKRRITGCSPVPGKQAKKRWP